MTTPNLPDPRPDGKCAECRTRQAATNDGRFCLKCLKAIIAQMTPIPGLYAASGRGRDHRAEPDREPSPWGENAVRHMEDQQ